MKPLVRWSWLGWLLLCIASASRAAAAEPVVHHTLDDRSLELARQESPQAAEQFEQAELLLGQGRLAEAEPLLAHASALAPLNPLLARRHCEVLTELGERDRAVAACRDMRARARWATAMDNHAYAAALMSGDSDPSPDEVAAAVQLADAARQLVGQPFSDAAFCEIARRLGDDAMLNQCLQNLEREAPTHYETKRWLTLKPARATWAVWLGWAALGIAGLGTIVHASLRKWRARAVARAASVALVTLGLLTLAPSAEAQAPAASGAAVAAPAPERLPVGQPMPPGAKEEDYKWQLSQFRINHDDPESSIPSIEARNAHALEFGYYLQDLAAEAVYAERRGDDRAAVKYWRAIAKAVPDSAGGFSRACKAYNRLKEFASARDYCSRTLNLPGVTLGDYALYGELMTSKPGKLTQLDIDDVNAIIVHLRRDPEGQLVANQVECQLGVAIEDRARLEHCTKALAKLTPNDPQTLIFQWSYALLRKDYGEAKRLVGVIKKTSIKPEALLQLEQTTASKTAIWRRFLSDWRYQLGLGLSLALAGLVVALRRRSPGPAQPSAPQPPATGGDSTAPSVTSA